LLDEEFAVPAGKRGGDRSLAGRAGRQQGKGRHAADRHVPADAKALGRGDGDPEAGEASRTDADQQR
jgi:hypothetical protein